MKRKLQGNILVYGTLKALTKQSQLKTCSSSSFLLSRIFPKSKAIWMFQNWSIIFIQRVGLRNNNDRVSCYNGWTILVCIVELYILYYWLQANNKRPIQFIYGFITFWIMKWIYNHCRLSLTVAMSLSLLSNEGQTSFQGHGIKDIFR